MNKGNNATTCIDSTVYENQTITDKKLMPEIFNDHFVNIGEKLANKIGETNADLLENVTKTEKRFTYNNRKPQKVWKSVKNIGNNKLIKRVKTTKCLHNIIDEHLTWEDHIEYVSKNIRRNIGVPKRLRNVIPRNS